MENDLIIIGAGPGGYVAGIRAAQLGAKVTLIEKDQVGGTCLNWGCIPTKALYKNAQVISSLEKMKEFGITLQGYDFDMKIAQSRKQEIVGRLQEGIRQLLKSNGIQVLTSEASLISNGIVEITSPEGHKEQIHGKYVLLATGSRPSLPPIPGIDLPGVITSDEALEFTTIPKSMVIVGGGVIGLEFASIFSAFGTEVTVLELLPRILPTVDEEMVRRLTPLLKKRGIKISAGVQVKEITRDHDSLQLFAESVDGKGKTFTYTAEIVLVSTGRRPNIENLQLDELGIQYNRSGIEVNEDYMTSVQGLYAIGDVIGGKMLAHVASEQGKIVAENLFGLGHKQSPNKINDYAVPACVFTFPELATVGYTEEEAKMKGISYSVSKFMFAANGKALTMGEAEGLVKVLAEKESKKIIGVHILGPHASSLIHEGVLAIENNLNAAEVGRVIHAHPTLAESFHEAILGLEEQAIHMVSRI